MKWLDRKKRRRNYLEDGVGVLESPSGVKFYVDADDFERCKRILWMVNGNGYAYNESVGYLHRFIMHGFTAEPREGHDLGQRMDVDHIDRDKRNCRKANLRFVTHKENCGNRNQRRDAEAQRGYVAGQEKYSTGRTF